MKICLTILLFLMTILVVFGQSDSIKKLSFSGYGEVYYSYDFSNPTNHEKPVFVYNHKRHNELNINLFLVKANYLDKKIRANIGLMFGNYPNYNLSLEPKWAQSIYEVNFGIKIASKKNIWLDVGIIPSHIGFESIISSECWTLTRSLLAENSPYYETGAKVTYSSTNEKLLFSALFLNGWQNISQPNLIQKPSYGMQMTYKPNPKSTFNYSNFIGNVGFDTLKSFRQFHNFYLQLEPNSNFGIILGLDLGFEKIINTKYYPWYSPIILIRQKISKNKFVTIRFEYFYDKNEIIVKTRTSNGFQTLGISSNFDYSLNDKMKIRFEGKIYNSKDKIFANYTNNINYSLTTNLSIKF